MTNNSKESVLKFPCDFPIKVVGRATEQFELNVLSIVRENGGKLKESSLSQRASKQGNYLALTIVVEAQNQNQLDNIYRALSSNPEVIMAL